MMISNYSDFLRSWLPWITAGSIAWRLLARMHAKMEAWADKLLDNHFKHMQDSLDEQSAALQTIQNQGDLQIDLLARIAEK